MNSPDTIREDETSENSEFSQARQKWHTAIQKLETATKEWNVLFKKLEEIIVTQPESAREIYATACAVMEASLRKNKQGYEADQKYQQTKEITDLISSVQFHEATAVLAEAAVLLFKEADTMVHINAK